MTMKGPRLRMMRPATPAWRFSASSSSFSLSPSSSISSAAWLSRRKSLGKALSPRAAACSRRAASLARRSAIRRFSSFCGEGLSLAISLQSLLQAGDNKLVQITIQHLVAVAGLHAGAQVLDALVVQHVGADLAAPADIGLGVLRLLLGGVALLHLVLPQLRLELLHGEVAVGVLAALALAGHHDAGGLMGDPHRRVGGVDVLAAGAAGAVGIDAQVRRVDLHLEAVVDLR